MKTNTFLHRLPSAFVVVLCTLIIGGCTKPLTKSDVQDDLKDAQEATQEAEEKTQEAYAARKQYYSDFRETRVKELEDRSSKIDDRISELEKVSKKSSNQAAQSDISSAIAELQDEKETVNERIVEVKSIKEEDWSRSYEEISAAIGKIEGEIDKLSQSLETNN
jgi:predicted  nucleic acid-binding Zn-ribbon protein